MKLKNLWGVLLILGLSIFAFTSCSSNDDDDDQTGTFEYSISYSEFNGNSESMAKVRAAFQEAFGVTSVPITLTGTRAECNRKAKEYAIKAQAALANEGSFGATIVFVNATTDEDILTFSIVKDDNGPMLRDGIKYVTKYSSVIFHNLGGKKMKIVSVKLAKAVFDGTIASDNETFELDRATNGHNFRCIIEGKDEPLNIRLPNNK